MKLGYKIIIGVLIGYGIYYYSGKSNKDKMYYTENVNDIITDIRHEDFFALQNRLAPNISSKISIENIKIFVKDLNFTKKSKFILEDIDKKNNIVKVTGIIKDSNTELPFNGTFIDNNGTLFIKAQAFGTKKLEAIKNSFPLTFK